MKEEIKEGYKKTEIGVIPEEWEVKRLGEIADIIMGQSPKSSSYNDKGHGLPFFQGKTEFGNIYPNTKYWCSKPIKISEPNDILLSVRAPVGDVNINNIKSCIGRGLAAIRHTKDSNFKFLFYLLKKCKHEFQKKAQGSTFTAINSNDIKNLKIPVPPLKEQQKIASILSTVDEHIEQTDKLIEKTKEFKKGLMQKIFSQEIRLKNENGENYPNWEEKRLGNLIEKVNLKYKHIKHTYHNKDVKFEVCTVSNKLGFVSQYDYFVSTKNNYEIASQDKSNYTIVGLGEFAYNPSRIDVGSIGLNEKYSNALVSPLYIVFKCKKDLEKIFLKYWLKTFYFENQMKRLMDVGVRNSLDYKSFSSMIIKLPSLSEQQKIASILSEVDNQIEEYELKKEKLKTLKKGLMQQLLTGKIRVKV